MIGIQGLAGLSSNKYIDYYNTSNYKTTSSYSDVGIAPITRYFIPIGKRNVVSLFGQASLPIVYSSEKRETFQTTGSTPYNTSSRYSEVTLLGSIGFGASLNGRLGSLELNINNTGLFLGFHKYFRKR